MTMKKKILSAVLAGSVAATTLPVMSLSASASLDMLYKESDVVGDWSDPMIVKLYGNVGQHTIFTTIAPLEILPYDDDELQLSNHQEPRSKLLYYIYKYLYSLYLLYTIYKLHPFF